MNKNLVKLNRKDHYGEVRDMEHPEVKFHQNGLNYNALGYIIIDQYATTAGISALDLDPVITADKLDLDRGYSQQIEKEKPQVKTTTIGKVEEPIVPETTPLSMEAFKSKPVMEEYILSKTGQTYHTEKSAKTNMYKRFPDADQGNYAVKPYKEGWAIVKS